MTHGTLASAQQAIGSGDWQRAARQLSRAAGEAAARGEAHRAAHCEQMAAALYRAAGSIDDALAAAGRSAARDSSSPRARFAAAAERAETLWTAGRAAEAAEAWQAARQEVDAIGLPAAPRATVLRRQALCLAHAGRAAEAWSALDQAAGLIDGPEHADAAAWVDVEQAQMACDTGAVPHALAMLGRQRVALAMPRDAHLRAHAQCVHAACALVHDDAAAARDHALAAREAALEAVAPLPYFTAAVSLGRAADRLGDRVGAYRALATAWATLADLLGQPVARSWVEPVLLALQLEWGADAFAAVRARHDEQRRAEVGRSRRPP